MNQKTNLGLINLDKTAASDVSIAFDNLYLHVSPIPRPLLGNTTRVIGQDWHKLPHFGPKYLVNLGKPVESEYDSSSTSNRRRICDGPDGLLKHTNLSPSSPELLNSSLESSPTTFRISHNSTFNRIQAMKRQCAVITSTAIEQDAKPGCSLSYTAIDERGKEDNFKASEEPKATVIKKVSLGAPLQSNAGELGQGSEEHTPKTGKPKAVQENAKSSAEIRKSQRIQKRSLISSNEKSHQNNRRNSPLKAVQKKAKGGNSFQKETAHLKKLVISGRKKADITDKEVTVLTDWIIKPIPCSRAVCVEGQKIGMNDFWHSTAISEVKNPKVVVTISGSTYRLKGRINRLCTIDNGFSKDIADAFSSGFPKNWRELIQDFYRDIEESITIHEEKIQPTRKMKTFKMKSSPTKKKTGKKDVLEKHSTVWTPGGLIQQEINTADVTVTRSGRISLPPLARWVGQRYIQVEGANKIQIGYKTKAAEQALSQVTDSILQLPKSTLAKTYHKSLSQSLQSPTTTNILNGKDSCDKNKKSNVQVVKVVLQKCHMAQEILTKTAKCPEAVNKTLCESKKQETPGRKNKMISVPNVSDGKSSHQKLKLRKYSPVCSGDVQDNGRPASDISIEHKLKSSFNKTLESQAEEWRSTKSILSVSYSDEPKKTSFLNNSSKKFSMKRRALDSSPEKNSTKKLRRQEESSHDKTVEWKQNKFVEDLSDSSLENNVMGKQKNQVHSSPEKNTKGKQKNRLHSRPEKISKGKQKNQLHSSPEKNSKGKQKNLLHSSQEKNSKGKQKIQLHSSPEKNSKGKQKNQLHSSPEKNSKGKQKKRNDTSPEENLRPTRIKTRLSDSNKKDYSEKLSKNSSISDSSIDEHSRFEKGSKYKGLHHLSTDEISISDSHLKRKGKHKKSKKNESSSSKVNTNSKVGKVSQSSEEENNYPVVKKGRKRTLKNANSVDNQEGDGKTDNKRKPKAAKLTGDESWTVNEKGKFHDALKSLDSDLLDYWRQVSQLVGTRSEMECQLFHKEFLESKLANPRKTDNQKKKTKVSGRQKGEPIKGGKGTLKRKQGLREFLDEQNEGYEDQLFEGSPYSSKRTTSLIAVDYNKNDSDVFGTNHNAFTPVAGGSLLSTPGTKLRAAMASVRKTLTESGLSIGNTPVSTERRLKADRLIKHFQERKKQSKSVVAANQLPGQNVDLDLSALPIKALFSQTDPNVFVDDDDEREPYYWDDE